MTVNQIFTVPLVRIFSKFLFIKNNTLYVARENIIKPHCTLTPLSLYSVWYQRCSVIKAGRMLSHPMGNTSTHKLHVQTPRWSLHTLFTLPDMFYL